MAANRELGGGLWLSDLPGWTIAPESAATRGAELGRRILAPAQTALGPLKVLSWYRPGSITDDGNVSGHASGAAVDVRLEAGGEGSARRLVEWIQEERAGHFGELLLERPGRHGRIDWTVHVTLPGVGGFGEVLEEMADGSWGVPGFGSSGTSSNPIELPGLVVQVDRARTWWPWALGAFLLLWLADRA